MARLKVLLRGTVISEIELSTEREYIGGRKEGCEIRLQPEKGISREHFKLKFLDGKWNVLTVSRFGDVFSLGQKVEQIELQHGQSFQVPPYDFNFLELPEAAAGLSDRPRIVELGENEKTVIGASQQVPYVKVVNTKGEIREMLRLEVGEVWVAGRDPSCQIIIPDQRVSRRQFEIYKVNGAYTILDLASVNGTFLNGSPVSTTDPQTLKSGDAITVLDNTMYFELHDPNFKYKIENIEIPPIHIELDSPPVPSFDAIREMGGAPVENILSSPLQPLPLPEEKIQEARGAEPVDGEVGRPQPQNQTQSQNQESFVGTEVTNQTEGTGQFEDFDESVVRTETGIEEVEEYDNLPQIQTGNSPFTGMPGPQVPPNQYYNYGPNQGGMPGMGGGGMGGGPSGPYGTAPQGPRKNKKNSNPLLLVIIVIAVLGGAYWYSENMGNEEPQNKVVVDESDPFNKLTPAQQKEVKELYSLAEQMYNQQKYDLALEKIRRLKEILPTGYKDSDKIELEAEQANLTLVQRQKDEEAQREREERELKNKQILAACQKLLNPQITSAEMSQCLAPVTAIDPNHPEHIRLMAEAEKIQAERVRKETEAKNYAEQVASLKELFATAEKTQSDGYAFKAIKQYKTVVESELPDPSNLKLKAKKRIGFIESKVREKSESSISSADQFVKQGKFKEAINLLRESVVYDPDNLDIRDKIEAYNYELMRQMRAIYQDSIIDENYGMIENTETKQGAKEKWKKITEMDLEDGEYYKKAIVKLRRYGVY